MRLHMILIKLDYALYGLNGNHKPSSHFSCTFFTCSSKGNYYIGVMLNFASHYFSSRKSLNPSTWTHEDIPMPYINSMVWFFKIFHLLIFVRSKTFSLAKLAEFKERNKMIQKNIFGTNLLSFVFWKTYEGFDKENIDQQVFTINSQ
jgi:hypothetical protein